MDQSADCPSCAPRSLQMTCGLFNTGSTDVTKVPSVGSMSDLGNQFGLDTKMADVDEFLKEGIWSPDIGDDLWSFGSELAKSDNFLEVFADLSNSCDFLFEGNITPSLALVATPAEPSPTFDKNQLVAASPSVELQPVIPPPQAPVEENITVRKRAASEACSTVSDSIISLNIEKNRNVKKRAASEAFYVASDSSNTDHDDYTTKFKKPLVVAEVKPETSEKDKYNRRRVKNNVASKQSRLSRKQKYVDMDGEALRLEAKNEELRRRAEQLEELAKEMKRILIEKMVQKK